MSFGVTPGGGRARRASDPLHGCLDIDPNPPSASDLRPSLSAVTEGVGSEAIFTYYLAYDRRGRIKSVTHPSMDTSFHENWRQGKIQSYTYNRRTGQDKVLYAGAAIISNTSYTSSGRASGLSIERVQGGFVGASEGWWKWTRDHDVLGQLQKNFVTRQDGTTELLEQLFSYNERFLRTGFRRSDPGLEASIGFDYGEEDRLDSWSIGSASP